MGNLDDLFPGIRPYSTERLPSDSSGGHYNACDINGAWGIAEVHYQQGNRHVFVDVADYEDEFFVRLYEVVTGLTAMPSPKIKNPKKWQMSREVCASVSSIDDYHRISDAVRDVAAKLRENYWARYKAALDLPLEEIITTKLQEVGIPPPYEA